VDFSRQTKLTDAKSPCEKLDALDGAADLNLSDLDQT
jgi:hypothetical protein